MASGARLGGSENIVPAMPLPPQIYNGQQTHLSIMIQTFGSPMFRRLRRITHTVFCTGDLPPTKPCDLPPRSPPGHTPRGSFLPPPRRDPVAEAARQGPWPSCCRVGSGWRGWMEGGREVWCFARGSQKDSERYTKCIQTLLSKRMGERINMAKLQEKERT